MQTDKNVPTANEFLDSTLEYEKYYFEETLNRAFKRFIVPDKSFEDGSLVFNSIFTNSTESIKDTEKKYKEYIKWCTEYTSIGGKMIRGFFSFIMFVIAITELEPEKYTINSIYEDVKNKKSNSILQIASNLFWANEILQGSLLTTDDIMDHGVERRGKACWKDVVGVEQAVLDGMLLMNVADVLVTESIEESSENKLALDYTLFWQKCKNITVYGQHNDIHNFSKLWKELKEDAEKNKEEVSLDKTLAKIENHLKTVYISKTSYYTFVLPIILGVKAAEMKSGKTLHEEKKKQLELLAVNLGAIFQLQDDFIDVFMPEMLKKPCTDIQEGKTTWCLWAALKAIQSNRDNSIDWIKFADNYSNETKNNEIINEIKETMKDLNIQGRYKEIMNITMQKVMDEIKKLSNKGNMGEIYKYYGFEIIINMLKKRCISE